jgi:hypothetical protein
MIYPLIPNDQLPRSNPYGLFNSILPWNWLNSKWSSPIKTNIEYIESLKGYIPVGTSLYHGSLDHHLDFNKLKKDKITFFGLDAIISIWYILELEHIFIMNRRNIITHGKLYEFKVIKPIPIHILHELYDHPNFYSVCKKNEIACIHPQIAFHGTGDAYPPYDLGIEITMNMKYFSSYIKLHASHIVNIETLYKNRRKLFSQFNPIEAIVDSTEYKEKKEKKEKKS